MAGSAPEPVRLELSVSKQLGCRRPRKPQLSAAASPKARGQRERTERLRCAPGRGELPLAMLLSSRGRAKRAESAQPADFLHRLPPARAPALCKILPGTGLPAALQRQRVIAPAASRSRLDGYRSRAREATRNPERATAVKEATRPRRSDALSEGAPSRSLGLPASIQPQGPRLQPHSSAELGLASKQTLGSPGYPQLYLAKVGVFPALWTPTSGSWWVFSHVFH